jgi:hypothetical protein
MSLADEINEILGPMDEDQKWIVKVHEAIASLELDGLDERMSGGQAYSTISKEWRKRAMDLLSLVTKLRLNTNAIAKTPGYNTGSGGKDRPGVRELEDGVKHLTMALRDINKGLEKLSMTTFLEQDETDLTEKYRGRAAEIKLQNKTRPHIEALKAHLGRSDYSSAFIYLSTKVLRKKEWTGPAKALEALSGFGSLGARGGTAHDLWQKALMALRDKDWRDYRDYGWSELEKL